MSSLLEDAIAELYAADSDAFTARRDALGAAARAAGDPLAAKQIAALRKPTRAAGLLNRFAREHPEVLDQLNELGEALRRAQRTMDGASLRQLSARRRTVISAAVSEALGESGSEAMRAPVTSTLEAALADPDVAAELARGALVRPIEWSGFGDAAPSLTVVPMPPRRPARELPSTDRDGPESARTTGATKAAAKAAAAAREQAIADAEAELAAAQDAVRTADELRTRATATIERLEEDLVQARLDLRAASAQHRTAQTRERDAQRRARRARGVQT